ncbi:MAG: hypothetical protein Q9222_001782 [Ikaeria aurantiellina]
MPRFNGAHLNVNESETLMSESYMSQRSDDQNIKDMAKVLRETIKRRRDLRRSKIEKRYRQDMQRLEVSLVTNLDVIASRMWVGRELEHVTRFFAYCAVALSSIENVSKL